MSRITDGSGIPISDKDRNKLIDLGARLETKVSRTIQHYLVLFLDDGQLIYDVQCTAGDEGCELPGEYEACGYNEWLSAAGIENIHHGKVALGAIPMAFDLNPGDDCEMRAI